MKTAKHSKFQTVRRTILNSVFSHSRFHIALSFQILLFLLAFQIELAHAQTPKQDFKWVVEPKYKSVQIIDDSLFLAELSENKQLVYGFVDTKGDIAVHYQFDNAGDFSEGMAAVRLKGGWGFIDKSGKLVIEPKYWNVTDFSEGLAAIEINNKWGFVNKAGKVVVEPKYDNIRHFSQGFAAVNIGAYTRGWWSGDARDIAKEGGEWGLIDKTGKVIVTPKYTEIGDIHEGLAVIFLDNKYGFIDKTGKVIITPQYGFIGDFHEGVAIIKLNSKWGLIDKTGKVIVEPQYEEISNFQEGLATIKLNGKRGLIDKTGKVIVEPQYEEISNFHEGVAIIKLNSKWGLIDKTGKVIVEPQYDEIRDFYKGLVGVKIVITESYWNRYVEIDKWGLIDKTGKVIVEPTYGEIRAVHEGLAKVNIGGTTDNFLGTLEGGKWGLIDKIGKIIVEPKYEEIGNFHEGLAKVKIAPNHVLINHKGVRKYYIHNQYSHLGNFYFSEGLSPIKINKRWGYMDIYGNMMIEPQYEWITFFCEGLSEMVQNNKLGFIDKTGRIVIEPQFEPSERRYQFHEGLAVMASNGSWGYIDKAGKFVIEANFDMGGHFSEGLAAVRTDSGLWGYIDKSGKMVIEPNFANAGHFSEGLAPVRTEGGWAYIDKTGKFVIEPTNSYDYHYGRYIYELYEVGRFIDGFAKVLVDKKYVLINKRGKIALKPNFKAIEDLKRGKVIVQDSTTNLWGVIEISTIPPTIALTFPEVKAGKASAKGESLTVRGRVTDDIGVRSVLVNGKTAFLSESGEFVLTDLPLSESENKIEIEAEDVNANVSTLSFSVVKEKDVSSTPTQAPTLAQLSAKNYHALVIAAQDYQHWGKLGKPIADADSMIKTLTTFYLFDRQNITYLKNPRRSDLIDAFDSLTEVLTETDNLLIFYAGHGQEDLTLNEGYWIPIDGQTGNRRSNWFSNEELKKYVKAMKCKHVLLVADACFAGKLFRGEENQPSAKPNIDKTLAIQNDYKKKSRVGITSTKLTTVPDDSIFLRYFLLALQENRDKYLRASELHSLFNLNLQNNSRYTSERSVIFETGDEGGEFIFIRKE